MVNSCSVGLCSFAVAVACNRWSDKNWRTCRKFFCGYFALLFRYLGSCLLRLDKAKQSRRQMAFNCYLKQVPSRYSDISCSNDGDCLKCSYLTLLLSAMLSKYQAAACHTPGCHIHALLHGLCANKALFSSIGVLPSVCTGLCHMLGDQNFVLSHRDWATDWRIKSSNPDRRFLSSAKRPRQLSGPLSLLFNGCRGYFGGGEGLNRRKVISITHLYVVFVCFVLARQPPQWARVSSFLRFLNHKQRSITVGRTPLDEWSARRRDLYLTTHNTYNRQTFMPPVGFEPKSQQASGRRPTL